jgi:hypothetical protein
MNVEYFTSKPKYIRAIQWLGTMDNYSEIQKFCRFHVQLEDLDGYATGALSIWNVKEECWVRCPRNHYVIEGIDGEFYPCDSDIMERSYRRVSEDEFRRSTGKAV